MNLLGPPGLGGRLQCSPGPWGDLQRGRRHWASTGVCVPNPLPRPPGPLTYLAWGGAGQWAAQMVLTVPACRSPGGLVKTQAPSVPDQCVWVGP